MALMIAQLQVTPPYLSACIGQFAPYPEAPRQKCDFWIGDPLQWAIEVKMARFKGDNGRPDDTAIKDLLSPYPSDRSALADCTKLARSGFACSKAMLIYGFDSDDRPLEPVIVAFETLARARATLGSRCEAPLGSLVHPVFSRGRVFAWELISRA
jgi:hypothetical protein